MRFFKKNKDQDALSINMQNEVITISEKRLGKPLQKALKQKVLQKKMELHGLGNDHRYSKHNRNIST